MQQIEIDFEVFKALTARRLNPDHSNNDVIRDLLGLDSLIEPPDPIEILCDNSGTVYDTKFGTGSLLGGATGFSARGIFLPNGSVLKATYKQQQHIARIESGRWIDADGKSHSSPSAAAKHITHSSVNGLRFWSVKRPKDPDWRRLDLLK